MSDADMSELHAGREAVISIGTDARQSYGPVEESFDGIAHGAQRGAAGRSWWCRWMGRTWH
jgi:hypothetical protein